MLGCVKTGRDDFHADFGMLDDETQFASLAAEDILTKRARALQRSISSNKPLATIILWVLAIPRTVIVNGLDTTIPQFLRQLAIPVDVGETLSTAVRFRNGLDLDAKVVMSDHG